LRVVWPEGDVRAGRGVLGRCGAGERRPSGVRALGWRVRGSEAPDWADCWAEREGKKEEAGWAVAGFLGWLGFLFLFSFPISN
jgi:hypothetical protein